MRAGAPIAAAQPAEVAVGALEQLGRLAAAEQLFRGLGVPENLEELCGRRALRVLEHVEDKLDTVGKLIGLCAALVGRAQVNDRAKTRCRGCGEVVALKLVQFRRAIQYSPAQAPAVACRPPARGAFLAGASAGLVEVEAAAPLRRQLTTIFPCMKEWMVQWYG
jgi:hypothetical protein